MDEDDSSIGAGTSYGTCGMLPPDTSSGDGKLSIIKSRLCLSYIDTLCSYLELDWHEPKSGNDVSGWDVAIEPVRNRDEWETKPELYIQLKAEVCPPVHNGCISYELDRRTYDRLRISTVRDRSLLALLYLDDDPSLWVDTNGDSLVMRRVMYWCKIDAGRELPDGQENVTLHLPLTNVLDKSSLHKMMDVLSRGEVFGNEL